jgi:hypothetical protein
MPLTPQQILDRLVAILQTSLRTPEACFRDDGGSFSRCGVFGDCSHFMRDRYEGLSPLQRRQLADFALECMSQTDQDLGDAAATCFLENLTFERFSKDFESYLSGQARDFFRRFQGA